MWRAVTGSGRRRAVASAGAGSGAHRAAHSTLPSAFNTTWRAGRICRAARPRPGHALTGASRRLVAARAPLSRPRSRSARTDGRRAPVVVVVVLLLLLSLLCCCCHFIFGTPRGVCTRGYMVGSGGSAGFIVTCCCCRRAVQRRRRCDEQLSRRPATPSTSWLVHGCWTARSRRDLGAISARSRHDLRAISGMSRLRRTRRSGRRRERG